MTPKTLEEWTAYVEKLSGAELRSKAMAANSLDFMRQLEAEGTPPQEVMKILKVFAKRFAATGQEMPSRYEGALVDYERLLNPATLPTPEAISDSAVLAHRVVARYQRRVAAENVWLPDLLGAKAHIVDELLKAVKRMISEESNELLRKDSKSVAGGLCYFILRERAGESVAQKLWNLLDSSAGLDASEDVRRLGEQAARRLTPGREKGSVEAAGIGVALLQRTRQQTKAQRANAVLLDLLKEEVTEYAPSEEGGAKSATEAFADLVAELSGQAQATAAKIKKDAPMAAVLVSEVLADVNAHEQSSVAESILSPLVKGEVDQIKLRKLVGPISAKLDYGVVEAGAFGVALMTAVGQPSYARKLQTAMVRAFKEFLGPGTMF